MKQGFNYRDSNITFQQKDLFSLPANTETSHKAVKKWEGNLGNQIWS